MPLEGGGEACLPLIAHRARHMGDGHRLFRQQLHCMVHAEAQPIAEDRGAVEQLETTLELGGVGSELLCQLRQGERPIQLRGEELSRTFEHQQVALSEHHRRVVDILTAAQRRHDEIKKLMQLGRGEHQIALFGESDCPDLPQAPDDLRRQPLLQNRNRSWLRIEKLLDIGDLAAIEAKTFPQQVRIHINPDHAGLAGGQMNAVTHVDCVAAGDQRRFVEFPLVPVGLGQAELHRTAHDDVELDKAFVHHPLHAGFGKLAFSDDGEDFVAHCDKAPIPLIVGALQVDARMKDLLACIGQPIAASEPLGHPPEHGSERSALVSKFLPEESSLCLASQLYFLSPHEPAPTEFPTFGPRRFRGQPRGTKVSYPCERQEKGGNPKNKTIRENCGRYAALLPTINIGFKGTGCSASIKNQGKNRMREPSIAATTITRRNLLILGSSTVLAGMFAPGASFAQDAKTVVMTINPEPNAMLSAFNTASPVTVISSKMTEGLLDYDFELKPQPALATSWEVAPDGHTITFKLRDGVKWHDGQPFSSADVAYSIMEILKQHHPRGRGVFANVTAVETPDALTAVLKLSEPSPALMFALSGWESPILPKHVYEGTDVLKNPANNAPIGTGPYKFVQWERGSHIILERNPDYWEAGKPVIDRLIVRIYADSSARVAAFEAGELHLGGDGPIPLNEVKRFQEDPNFKVETRGIEMNNSLDVLELNLRNEHLAKIEVRKALMHAIDREAMKKTVWYDLAEVLTGPLPQTLPHFYSADVPAYPYDPAKAEALLDEAGFAKGGDGMRFKLRLIWPAMGDTYDRAGQFLRQQLRKVGVDLELQAADVPTFIRQVYGEYNFDISMFPASVTADPSIGSQRFYHSAAIAQGTPFVNASNYQNPKMDEVLDKAASEPAEDKRAELFKRFQQIAMEDLPILPLARPIYVTVASAKLDNFVTGPEGVRGRYASLTLAD